MGRVQRRKMDRRGIKPGSGANEYNPRIAKKPYNRSKGRKEAKEEIERGLRDH